MPQQSKPTERQIVLGCLVICQPTLFVQVREKIKQNSRVLCAKWVEIMTAKFQEESMTTKNKQSDAAMERLSDGQTN